MKKKILLQLIFTALVHFSGGQVQRCATAEIHQQRMKTDAQYREYCEGLEKQMQEWLGAGLRTTSNITIPVVVHVLYNTSAENISDAQIQSQIDVLNKDYNAANSDLNKVPPPFNSVIGNAHLSFCLATRTPANEYTTGIERRFTTVTDFGSGDIRIKMDSLGGLNAWDSKNYLNIWLCNIGNLLGYAEMPGGPVETDGVVINYKAFGTVGSLVPAYNKGRSATHEIGHWLNLLHIWGDDGGDCNGSDFVDDTPNQGGENFGCPVFPKTDGCSPASPGVMFMNFMDYVNDACMNMFTAGQVTRMLAALNISRSTILSSNKCTLPSVLNELDAASFFNVYPNPAREVVFIESRMPSLTINSVIALDMLGKKVIVNELEKREEGLVQLDVSALSSGIYTLILNAKQGIVAKRFVIAK